MPTVTEQSITALAFCIDGRCAGYNQQPVEAVSRTNEFSYVELGGDLPGIERSTTQVMFANEADAVCPHCGKPRLISEQERPQYPNTSGMDPMAIFQYRDQQNQNQVRDLMRDQESEKLRREAENAELRAQLANVTTLLERQASVIDELQSRPRGPGRPRNVKEDE